MKTPTAETFRRMHRECRKGIRRGAGPELLQMSRAQALEYGVDLQRAHCALCNRLYLKCPCDVVSLAPGSPIALAGVGERRSLAPEQRAVPGVTHPAPRAS